MTDHVLVSDADGVRTIRHNRADKKNALTRAMYSAMADALREGDADSSVRVFILAGAPGAFTAGNDLIDFMRHPPDIGAEPPPPVEFFMRTLVETRKPVIAAVDGIAVGIGVTLLMHCDLVYASERAAFKTPFVDLGLAPEFASSMLMPATLGRAAASELILLGETWGPERALQAGLISGVFPAETLDAEVMARAAALAVKAPGAVCLAKALMTLPPEGVAERITREGRLFAERLKSPEFAEAAAAFMGRRKPDFSKFG